MVLCLDSADATRQPRALYHVSAWIGNDRLVKSAEGVYNTAPRNRAGLREGQRGKEIS